MSTARYVPLAWLCAILLCGCTSDTSTRPVSTTDADSVESATDLPANVEPSSPPHVEVPPFETAPPIEYPEFATAQEYVERMQQQLADSSIGKNQPPTNAGINLAIATSDRGLAKFSDDENLLLAASMLRYQSLQRINESDPEEAVQRRLKLGQFARMLVGQKKELSDRVRGFASILTLEESKAYVAQQDNENAWASLREARALGFNQSELLFFDPAFAPIVKDENRLPEIKTWLTEEANTRIAAADSFPLEFTLRSLTSDEEVSLSDFRGKLVIVDFWGTWCPPCRAAIPHLVELAEEYKDDLAIVGLNFERGASFEEAKIKLASFLSTQPINYPCLYGEHAVSAQVPGFGSFPTMVFVDKSGTVRLSVTGYQPLPVLEATINALLAL